MPESVTQPEDPVVEDPQILKENDWRSAFSLYDRKKAGSLHISQIGAVMRSLDFRPTDEELISINEEFGVDSNNCISLENFLIVMGRFDRQEAKFNQIFHSLKVR
jgi:Ca2+-binding EF-hand superfamily protein